MWLMLALMFFLEFGVVDLLVQFLMESALLFLPVVLALLMDGVVVVGGVMLFGFMAGVGNGVV